MTERKVSEPKLAKCGTFKYRTVKIGNKTLGTIEPYKSEDPTEKTAVYWISSQEVGRISNGGKTLVFSRPKLIGLSAYGVKKLGLRMPDGRSYVMDYQKVTQVEGVDVSLPIKECESLIPPIEERVETLFGKLLISKRSKR
jgi:hypothetical protein